MIDNRNYRWRPSGVERAVGISEQTDALGVDELPQASLSVASTSSVRFVRVQLFVTEGTRPTSAIWRLIMQAHAV